jgi:hypothetical protein
VTAVEILDKASAAAWDCRNRGQAITAAQRTLRTSPAAEATAAFAAWRRALGYDGPTEGLGAHLVDRYRNPGDIALSLTRAAYIAEAGDLA